MDDQPAANRDWSSLPADLLSLVLKRLSNTDTDCRRLRAVCTSWRSSLSPLRPKLKFPVAVKMLPFSKPSPSSKEPVSNRGDFGFLRQSIFYLISLPNESSSERVWLTRVEETMLGRNTLKLQNPLSRDGDFIPRLMFNASVNLLDYRFSEVARSYHLPDGSYNSCHVGMLKTVMLPLPNSEHGDEDFSLLTLIAFTYEPYKDNLFLLKSRKENWVMLTGVCHPVGDIIACKGKFYATDLEGNKLITIDPITFEIKEIIKAKLQEPTFEVLYSYLVESHQRLYLVQKIVQHISDDEHNDAEIYGEIYLEPLELKVFVLSYVCSSNGSVSRCWEPVTSLGDRVFFVGNYVSFSVSAQELGWNQGNCVFFTHADLRDTEFFCSAGPFVFYDSYSAHGAGYPTGRMKRFCGLYTLKDGRIIIGRNWLSEYKKLFWPVPSWLATTSTKQ